MLGRRLLLLMAVLLGLTALTTSLAPRPRVTTPRATATPTPAASPAPTPGVASPSRVVERTIDANPGARVPRVRAREGDTLRLVVRGDVLDAVELEGLAKIEPVEPASPARFEFRAEAPGEHPIVLIDAERTVALLEIRAGER